MSVRIVKGLKWARRLDSKPPFIPNGRPRGAKAQGLRYERKVAKALPEAEHGVWFEFEDQEGVSWCQTDFLLRLASGLVILESKYTWTEEAHQQLDLLYRPVVEKALLVKDTKGIVICKTLIPGCRALICRCLDDAILTGWPGSRTLVHWLGETPLWAQSRPRPKNPLPPLRPAGLAS